MQMVQARQKLSRGLVKGKNREIGQREFRHASDESRYCHCSNAIRTMAGMPSVSDK